MIPEIRELLSTCTRLSGSIPRWTQGQGSNVSYKNSNHIWIKPSGRRLDEVKTEHDLCVVDLQDIRERLIKLSRAQVSDEKRDADYAEVLTHSRRQTPDLRPSMETGFHVFLNKSFVWHFHSLIAIYVANLKDQSSFVKPPLPHTILDYVPPGAGLSMALLPFADTDVIFLRNHGVIVQGESIAALDTWMQYENDVMQTHRLKIDPVFNNSPVPFKVVFPDLAVFGDRVRDHLEPVGPLMRLRPGVPKNVMEMWWANHWLTTHVPDLPELSLDEQKKLPNMPTEVFRRQNKS